MWYNGVHRPPIGRADLVKYFEDKGYDKTLAIYAAQVKAIDESVGRIRETLRQTGIDEETVIVLLSDQGSWYENLPLRGTKRIDTLCEGGARVPMMIHWPGVTKPNATSETLVQSTDLFPTLVEIAGGNVASGKMAEYANLDGISLMPLLRGNQPLNRDAPLFGYRAYQDLYASVRQADWNMLAYRSGKVCLYDVAKDVSEQDDVANQHPEVVQ